MTTDVWLALLCVAFLAGGISTALAIRWLAIRADVRQGRRELDDL